MSSTEVQRTESDGCTARVEQPDISPAAKFNKLVLRKLQRAVERDPEVDLQRLLPSHYSSRLAAMTIQGEDTGKTQLEEDETEAFSEPQDIQPDQTAVVKVVHPLSTEVMSLLGVTGFRVQSGTRLSKCLSEVVKSSTVIFRSTASCRYVSQCNQSLIVKVTELNSHPSSGKYDFTEYNAMQYLAENEPDFIAPKLHGLLTSDGVSYLFMTHIPGATLESIWQHLTIPQKHSLALELDQLLLKIRLFPRPPNTPLGGVGGEGCKDMRRHVRFADRALHTDEDFWQFMYGDVGKRDTVYLRFLRQLTDPPEPQEIVFTHGGIRPANLVVQEQEAGNYSIGGIIDWGMSGFYPSDYECIRATNNLSTIQTDDWYLYLPSCISPREHFRTWASDRMWDPYLA